MYVKRGERFTFPDSTFRAGNDIGLLSYVMTGSGRNLSTEGRLRMAGLTLVWRVVIHPIVVTDSAHVP